MSVRAPSQQQITAQIDSVLQRAPETRLIGIRSPVRRSWPEVIERDGARFRVLWSDSGLELRERLAEIDEGDERVVVLTSLPDEALGADLLARFARARLLQAEGWAMLRAAFGAHDIDPRLAGEEWLAELLLEHAPANGYPPVPGGVLDADTAWRHLLERTMGLEAMRPDTEALLAWSMDDAGLTRFQALPDAVRSRIAQRLEQTAGSAAGLVMGAVATGHGPNALALGLVLGVVFGDYEERELRDAAVRLEPVFGRRLTREPAVRLALAAGRMVLRIDRTRAEACQIRAAEWLETLHIASFAQLSDYVAAGFEQRLEVAAEALRIAVEKEEALGPAQEAVDRTLQHEQARIEDARAERLRMALRLVRWLATSEPPPANLPEAARRYARDGAFVDLARTALFGGEQSARVSHIYGIIVDRATARRERENEAFARALERWNRETTASTELVPLEQLLDRILAPLAEQANLLLIVLDGLSYAVHRHVMLDVGRQGWVELVPEGRVEAPPLISALPSLTEVCRASLFSGRLTQGKATDERRAFAEHPSLLAKSRAGRPPLLFHKAELGLANGLTGEVCAAIAERQQRIVGLVHNVVDAQLDGSDQLVVRWGLDDLRLMRALLREARDAGRIVVIASDHGHILDRNTVQHTSDGGDRWRRGDGPLKPFEMVFEGGRVLSPDGTRRVVLPFSEAVRYGSKSRGYHGGATPQEVVAPLAVLTTNTVPAGWSEAPPVEPHWWEEAQASPAPPPAKPMPRPDPKREQHPELLFPEPKPLRARGWIAELLASPTYAAQKRLVGRAAPKDEDIVRLLEALEERGGRLSQTAVAQAMRQPTIRIGGLVSAAARVLNVDQSRIIYLDRPSGTVTLERALLERQFELGKR